MEKNLTLNGYRKGKSHYLPIRIYYADTDCGGIVHHSRYVEFLERGRTEALRLSGIEEKIPPAIKNMAPDNGEDGKDYIILPLISLNLNYKAPARHNDIILVETQIEKISGVRLYAKQKIFAENRLLVEADCCLTLITAEGRLRPIPDSWRAILL